MKVGWVPAEQAHGFAAAHPDMFGEFTGRGEGWVEDIVQEIAEKDRQCWTVMDGDGVVAIALTRILVGAMKVCEITHVTGTGLEEWADAYLEIEKWARYTGCARIKALARPGYERFGRRYGLKKSHVLLEKDL